MLAVEFEKISKQYRLGLVTTGTLSHDLKRWWTTAILRQEDPYLKIGEVNDRLKSGESEYVWALRNINFAINEGEVVGIIGRNGSGKSTLLKLLSRVTAPTIGLIRVHGRIASLLEVGTGFHPEMTGRENIYLNGAIMGMTKAEIAKKMDEIVEFSGCERYLDTPVKRYSSGMIVRLGFAIAAHLEPEILVVDEVLAVGDAEFQRKAIGKMQDVAHAGGRTVLFVSHNMNAVRNLCTRGIVLDKGMVVYDSDVRDAVDFYLSQGDGEEVGDKEIADCIVPAVSYIRIDRVSFNGTTKTKTRIRSNQEFVDVEVEGYTELSIKVDLFVIIRNPDESPLASFSLAHTQGKLESLESGAFCISRRLFLPNFLFPGHCTVDLDLHHPRVSVFFSAPKCVSVEIEGSPGQSGMNLDLRNVGLVGFNSEAIGGRA